MKMSELNLLIAFAGLFNSPIFIPALKQNSREELGHLIAEEGASFLVSRSSLDMAEALSLRPDDSSDLPDIYLHTNPPLHSSASSEPAFEPRLSLLDLTYLRRLLWLWDVKLRFFTAKAVAEHTFWIGTAYPLYSEANEVNLFVEKGHMLVAEQSLSYDARILAKVYLPSGSYLREVASSKDDNEDLF